jgi:hypothetical protein
MPSKMPRLGRDARSVIYAAALQQKQHETIATRQQEEGRRGEKQQSIGLISKPRLAILKKTSHPRQVPTG